MINDGGRFVSLPLEFPPTSPHHPPTDESSKLVSDSRFEHLLNVHP